MGLQRGAAMERLRVFFRVELTRRNLLRGGALVAAGSACGVSNAGPFAPTVSSSGAATTSAAGATSTSGTGTSATSGSGASSTGSGASSSGACIPTCMDGSNVFSVPRSQIPVGGGMLFADRRFHDAMCSTQSTYPSDGFAVVQPTAGQFLAFSLSCTHSCCEVGIVGGEFYCACHGSTFSLSTGARLSGLAPVGSSLQSIPVCVDDCAVHVTLA